MQTPKWAQIKILTAAEAGGTSGIPGVVGSFFTLRLNKDGVEGGPELDAMEAVRCLLGLGGFDADLPFLWPGLSSRINCPMPVRVFCGGGGGGGGAGC